MREERVGRMREKRAERVCVCAREGRERESKVGRMSERVCERREVVRERGTGVCVEEGRV